MIDDRGQGFYLRQRSRRLMRNGGARPFTDDEVGLNVQGMQCFECANAKESARRAGNGDYQSHPFIVYWPRGQKLSV